MAYRYVSKCISTKNQTSIISTYISSIYFSQKNQKKDPTIPPVFLSFDDMMSPIHKAITHLQIILHILRSHIDIIAEISLKRILTDLKVSTLECTITKMMSKEFNQRGSQ